MGHRTDLADLLRVDPVLAPRVVELAGWRERGSSTFSPLGFVWHHTAGPLSGNAPSLAICTYGRTGLPGPLCNLFLARDGTVYVVAAGRANHAGSGSWRGLTGNSSVWGLEIENTGYGTGPKAEPWSPLILDLAARIVRALRVDPDLACHHKEWTSRKVDMHTVGGAAMREAVRKIDYTAPPSPAPPPALAHLESGPMFLVAEGVGLFVIVEGVPIGFPNLVEYAKALDESPKVPVLWLRQREAEPLMQWLLRKLAASVD